MSAALLIPFVLQSIPPADTRQIPGELPPTEIEAPAPETKERTEEGDVPPVDNEVIDGRRRPGYVGELPDAITQRNEGALRAPPPQAFPTDQIPIPDRWRLIETLGVVKERWWDPYNQNTYKGDRPINPDKVPWLPINGKDWFFVANVISDTVFEPRTFPIRWASRRRKTRTGWTHSAMKPAPSFRRRSSPVRLC